MIDLGFTGMEIGELRNLFIVGFQELEKRIEEFYEYPCEDDYEVYCSWIDTYKRLSDKYRMICNLEPNEIKLKKLKIRVKVLG